MSGASAAGSPRLPDPVFVVLMLGLAAAAWFVHFAFTALVLLLGLRMGLDRLALRRASAPPSRASDRKER